MSAVQKTVNMLLFILGYGILLLFFIEIFGELAIDSPGGLLLHLSFLYRYPFSLGLAALLAVTFANRKNFLPFLLAAFPRIIAILIVLLLYSFFSSLSPYSIWKLKKESSCHMTTALFQKFLFKLP